VNRPFRFQKCCQDFVGTHDETLSVAMCVNNPDRSTRRINGGDTAPTPSGFGQIIAMISQYFTDMDYRCSCSKPFAVHLCSLQAVRSLSADQQ
jgi:hypothetical protein